jgi:hypothetical protein
MNLEEISTKIEKLQELLLTSDPKMPEHLRAIHRTLIQYEELSHLLKEDQIAVLIEAAGKKLGVMLAEETKKGNKKLTGGADEL